MSSFFHSWRYDVAQDRDAKNEAISKLERDIVSYEKVRICESIH
jgi:hypothetical protein